MSEPSSDTTVLTRIQLLAPEAIERVSGAGAELQVYVGPARLKRMMGRLLNDEILGPGVLCDLAVLPTVSGPGQIEVVYSLMWPEWRQRLAVRVPLADSKPKLDSISGIWPCADWLEREAWDLCGVVFEGHPDLRRILLPEDAQGHPLTGRAAGFEESGT